MDEVRGMPRPEARSVSAPGTTSLDALAERTWDVLVVGGGITGAGVMREAARAGLCVLLLERDDFASGTSSRSSKLIHGGLHYLARGELGLFRRASRERERLLRAGGGLVRRLAFRVGGETLTAVPGWLVRPLVVVYRLGARSESPAGASALTFSDAQVDDARLVLRVVREGCQRGGRAVNYVRVDGILSNRSGRTMGAVVTDVRSGRRAVIQARVVVNATGVWSEALRSPLVTPPHVRAVRGSHIVLPRRRLPLNSAVVALDPDTRRPLYALPWGPVTLVGSTAVPHDALDAAPVISSRELEHLLNWTRRVFPERRIGVHDIRSTFSGLRAIVQGQARGDDPRNASRDHAIASAPGMITVAGGKLTTFHDTAHRVVTLALKQLGLPPARVRTPALDDVPTPWPGLPFTDGLARRLLARYGPGAVESMACAPPGDLRPLSGLGLLPAEIRWVAEFEGVHHLDDLLLRRTRLGLTQPRGAAGWHSTIEQIARPVLGWSRHRWACERERYDALWLAQHGVPALPEPRTRKPTRAGTPGARAPDPWGRPNPRRHPRIGAHE